MIEKTQPHSCQDQSPFTPPSIGLQWEQVRKISSFAVGIFVFLSTILAFALPREIVIILSIAGILGTIAGLTGIIHGVVFHDSLESWKEIFTGGYEKRPYTTCMVAVAMLVTLNLIFVFGTIPLSLYTAPMCFSFCFVACLFVGGTVYDIGKSIESVKA